MSGMIRRFFNGNTLEQAVLAAARYYEIEPERVAYTIRDKRHGFLSVRRNVVIEIDPTAPSRPPGEEVPWEPKLAGRPERPQSAARSQPTAPAAPEPAAPESAVPESAPRASRGSSTREDEDHTAGIQAGPARSARERTVEEHVGQDREDQERPDPDRHGQTRAGQARAGEDRGRNHGRRGRPRKERSARRPRAENRPHRPERKPSKPAQPPITDDPLEAADIALGDLAELLLFDLQWDLQLDEEDALHVELSGDDSDRLVAEDGKVLRSIEHLLPRLMRSKLGYGVSCTLDCDGFREDHENSLQAFARRTAEEVRKTRESRLLDPMTPADRRLIHVTLANDPTVETRSEGHGFTKRVRITAA